MTCLRSRPHAPGVLSALRGTGDGRQGIKPWTYLGPVLQRSTIHEVAEERGVGEHERLGDRKTGGGGHEHGKASLSNTLSGVHDTPPALQRVTVTVCGIILGQHNYQPRALTWKLPNRRW